LGICLHILLFDKTTGIACLDSTGKMPGDEESIRDFIMPTTSPSKHYQSYPTGPESPDMKHARHRLGNLLSTIRKGEVSVDMYPREDMEPNFEAEEVKRGPGRPKKQKREKRVVFELRGKPFGLRDSGQPEPIYALCRKWMYGKDDEQETSAEEVHHFHPNRTQSLDLLATKDIYQLPLPRNDVPLMDPRPQKVVRSEPKSSSEKPPEEVFDDLKRHWKVVKKSWAKYSKKRQQRYSNSIGLLRTVYGIAQQTQQM